MSRSCERFAKNFKKRQDLNFTVVADPRVITYAREHMRVGAKVTAMVACPRSSCTNLACLEGIAEPRARIPQIMKAERYRENWYARRKRGTGRLLLKLRDEPYAYTNRYTNLSVMERNAAVRCERIYLHMSEFWA